MKTLLILFAACAFTAAFTIPKEKRLQRAVDPEERSEMTSTSPRPKEVCAHQTPCAWSIYQSPNLVIEHTIINSYCECSPTTVCEVNEDDTVASALIHRCRVPSRNSDDAVES